MPIKLLAWTFVTVALALAALPGMVDSAELDPGDRLPDRVFREFPARRVVERAAPAVGPLDPAGRSASYLAPDASLVDVGSGSVAAVPAKRPSVRVPAVAAGRTWKEPRYTLAGYASWYDNGTTAMRLPRGTVVVICGEGGCVERTINDYGPWKGFRPVRVVDLMPSDFAYVCGCPTWKGTAPVTVRVY